MGFTTIVPVEKPKTGAFRISTVAMRKDQPFRLQFSMPAAVYTLHFGQAQKLTVQIGDGADEGKMLIVPDEAGAFKPRFMKHTVLLRFPELEFVPQFQIASEDPERRRGPGGGRPPHRSAGVGLEQGEANRDPQGARAGGKGA